MNFNIIWFGLIGIFFVFGIFSMIYTRKVKNDGIETIASVSRIEEEESMDIDAMVSRRYTFYITYKNREGRQIEAMLSNPDDTLKVGSRIRIRYLPGREEYPVMTDKNI